MPEEVIAGGLNSVLKYVQERQNIRPVGLRKLIPKVEEQERAQSDVAAMPQGLSQGIEANAIAGHLLGSTWPSIAGWTKEHPGKIVSPNGLASDALHEMKDNDVLMRFVTNAESGFRDMRVGSQAIAKHFINAECRSRREEGDKVLARLEHLLKDKAYEVYKNNPESYLLAGFITASDITWGLFNTIPMLYRRRYGKEITPEAYSEIAVSAKELALSMAGLNLELMTVVRLEIEGDDYDRYSDLLEMQNLRLTEHNGHMGINLTESALRNIVSRYEFKGQLREAFGMADQETLKSGCPALFVSGQEGANVIEDYFNWSLSLVEKYYFPTLRE
jgi:hypothetical protein